MKNRGSITVEVSVVVPLFLFFMVAVSGIYMLILAEGHIKQSLAEAAVHVSKQAYLEERIIEKAGVKKAENIINQTMIYKAFCDYLGDDSYVGKVVCNGKRGILITVKPDSKNPKIFVAKARYVCSVKVPVLGDHSLIITNQVKQKLFLGYSQEEDGDQDDPYVYVTPEQSVYHVRRNCTHLSLTVNSVSKGEKDKYVPCHFCAKGKQTGSKIYVSRTNNIYHENEHCSGLKRTVRRVKKSETGGLNVCSRCGS